MKIQNILRTNVVVIGFAAAFLLAGGARAQEIDNTVWADSSNVEPFPQPASLAVANELNTVAEPSVQAETAAVIAQPIVNNEAIVSGGTAKEGWVIAMSIMLMAPLGVLLLAKVRRAKPSVNTRAYHSKRSAALS
jgi:cytochrome c-type biogenesis protein CcmH/NrfG